MKDGRTILKRHRRTKINIVDKEGRTLDEMKKMQLGLDTKSKDENEGLIPIRIVSEFTLLINLILRY